jgi:glycosyltransferase involved in cell wall biosynthesis
MKISMVATVKDAAAHVRPFLTSVDAQTRTPDEVVIVDGGSSDGTADVLRDAAGITLIEEPGANIARGRNVAIRAAAHDVIAVTDADCVLAPDWLERILDPIERGAEVSMGIYRPLAGSLFEACAAAISIPEPEELDPSTYQPSSRSVAFRRDAFERAGGYPEWLDIGEDMYLNHRWRDLDLRMDLARDAVVFRRPRTGLGAYWRQFFRYAEGDARGDMHRRRHALRFAVYGALALALGSGRRFPTALAATAGAAYAARPGRPGRPPHPTRPPRTAATVALPALMAVTDAAKMAGYLWGLIRR